MNSEFGDVVFSEAKFKNANFSNTKFGEAIFSDAEFENANFQRAEFGVGNFSEAKFRNVNFLGTKFKQAIFISSSFIQADFRGADIKRAQFSNSRFKEANFKGSKFEIANFSWAEFERADFSYSRFKKSLVFDNVSFRENVVIIPITGNLEEARPSSIEKRVFSQDPKECDKGHKRFCHPQPLAEAAKVQRIMYEKIGDREKADVMFVLEMRAKRKLRKVSARDPLKKLGNSIYNFFEWAIADVTSRYGTSWIRLISITVLTILLYAFVYWIIVNHLELGDIYHSVSPYQPVSDFLTILYYSIVTFTTLGYGDLYPTGIVRAISSLEAFTGAVFMALIVAVISRKWMR